MAWIKRIGIGIGIFLIVAATSLIFGLWVSDYRSARVRIGTATFNVEVAESAAQKAKGLSGRATLAADRGMVFLFPSPAKTGFWMAGMQFPIDIIWIRNQQVIGIASSLPTSTLNIYYPPEAVDTVLEINSGLAMQYNIRTGDAVELIHIVSDGTR